MSVECMVLVLHCYEVDKAEQAEKLLAVALANCASKDGEGIFPSVAYMAELSSQDKRTVKRKLAAMRAAGWLEQTAPATNFRPATYRINPDWIDQAYLTMAERRLAVPGRARGDTKSPPTIKPARGDTKSPQETGAGVTLATARGDFDDSTYIGEPSENKTPQPPKGGEGFEQLLAAYPDHRHKLKASRRQWDELAPDQALQRWIIHAAGRQSEQALWKADNGRAVPNLSTWLANEQWRQTPEPAPEAPAAQTAVTRTEGAPPAAAPIEPSAVRDAHRARLRELREQHSASVGTRRIKAIA